MMDSALPSVLISLLTWATFYLSLCAVWPKCSCEWHVRIVTMLHAIFITTISWICAYVQGPWPFTEAGGPNTAFQELIVTISLGYFLFDFSWCIYYKTEGPVMLFHHSLSIVGLGMTLSQGLYGCGIVATIFGSEITNPLLQLRWFLKESNRYDTILGEIVDVLFMTLFSVMRLGIGSYLLYTYLTNPRTDWFGRFGAVLIYSVGWAFMFSIVQFAIRKYTKKWRKWKGYAHLAESVPKFAATNSPAHDTCRETQGDACIQRVNKSIQEIINSDVDANTVEAIQVNTNLNNSTGIKKFNGHVNKATLTSDTSHGNYTGDGGSESDVSDHSVKSD